MQPATPLGSVFCPARSTRRPSDSSVGSVGIWGLGPSHQRYGVRVTTRRRKLFVSPLPAAYSLNIGSAARSPCFSASSVSLSMVRATTRAFTSLLTASGPAAWQVFRPCSVRSLTTSKANTWTLVSLVTSPSVALCVSSAWARVSSTRYDGSGLNVGIGVIVWLRLPLNSDGGGSGTSRRPARLPPSRLHAMSRSRSRSWSVKLAWSRGWVSRRGERRS
mmetsp:Transcript_6412/g.11450  ORF Transcript_6412/g.11450 Transcript_6412/m.11450 type:complete len:219 (+) Transcript_6412:1887-2543(+)